MGEIAGIVTPVFFTIVLGYLFGRVSHDSVSSIIDLAMYVTVPCLVFTSMLVKPIIVEDAARIWAAFFVMFAGTFLLALLFIRSSHRRHSGLYLPIIFNNTVSIPFPVIYLAFGSPGIAAATLFCIPADLLMFSLGVSIATGRGDWRSGFREAAKIPLIYAALLALALNLLDVRLPHLLFDSLQFVGQAAIPLPLLLLGINISRIRSLTSLPTTLVAGILRMGGGFAFGLLAVWLLGMTGLPRSVVLLEAAMPSAIFTTILATKYRNEPELVSSVVLVTTLASILTIPLLLLYVR